MSDKTDFTFSLEMGEGQSQRTVDADAYTVDSDWLIFYRKPPEGGKREYWRASRDKVVSMETKRSLP